MSAGSASSLYRLLLNLSSDAGYPLLVLFLLLLVFSLRANFGRREQPTAATLPDVFLWAWLLLPILIVEMISLRQPVLQTRYLILCLPPFLILASHGLGQLRSKAIFAGATMCFRS
jgi:hypothetical protein